MHEIYLPSILVTTALLAWLVNKEWPNIKAYLQVKKEENFDESMIRLGVDKTTYMLVTTALAIAGVVVGIVFLKNILAAVLLVVFTFMYRVRALYLKRRDYMALIESQAEVALQMISSLYDNMGDMVRAIEGTSECVASPMSDELKRIVAEYRAGKSLNDALTDFARRSNSRDIDVFVKGVLLSEKYGSDTAEVVSDVVDLVRDRITLRDELKNELKGQKLTISLFLLLIPLVGVGLFFFSPEAKITITTSLAGKAIICALITIEYIAWHVTSGQGMVEEL